MTVDTKKLRELAKAATPGPWRWGDSEREREPREHPMNLYSDGARYGIPVIWLDPSTGWVTLGANTDFIEAADPTTVLALLNAREDAVKALDLKIHEAFELREELAAALDEIERLREDGRDLVRILERISIALNDAGWPSSPLGVEGRATEAIFVNSKVVGDLRQQLAAMTAARDEACDLVQDLIDDPSTSWQRARERNPELRKVGT